MTVWGDGPTDYFDLPDGVDASLERFKLIVATEKVDDFLLAQPTSSRSATSTARAGRPTSSPPPRKVYTNEWFTRDFRIRVVRQASAT